MGEFSDKQTVPALGLVKRGVRALREGSLRRNGFESYQLGSPVLVNGDPHYVVAFKINDKGEREMGVLDREVYHDVGRFLRDIEETRKHHSTPLYNIFDPTLKNTEKKILAYAEANTKFFPFSKVDSEENVRKRALSIRRKRIDRGRRVALAAGALPNLNGRIL